MEKVSRVLNIYVYFSLMVWIISYALYQSTQEGNGSHIEESNY